MRIYNLYFIISKSATPIYMGSDAFFMFFLYLTAKLLAQLLGCDLIL